MTMLGNFYLTNIIFFQRFRNTVNLSFLQIKFENSENLD